MRRVTLIHWKAAEVPERLERLRGLGYESDAPDVGQGSKVLRAVRENPPDAFVIDLGRLPSQGRDIALQLRGWASTRPVPLVFAEGKAEKVESLRELLPDATYTTWDDLGDELAAAIARPSVDPVVPRPMEGYSGTPLPKKLGVKPGSTVALLGAPDDFTTTLGTLPEGVRVKTSVRGSADLILLFARSRAEMRRRFPAASRALAEKGGLWIVWPKKASGLATDLTQADVRRFGLDAGFVDYKICAVDPTWSGLLFARRRA